VTLIIEFAVNLDSFVLGVGSSVDEVDLTAL